MKTPARVIIGIFLAVGIFLAGYMANRQHDPAVSAASDKQEIRYTCPMHPQYGSDRSGTCPVCGMSLVLTNSGEKMVKDLVCGMEVDPQSASVLKAQYKGKTYYFCAEMCKKSFEADPGKYIQKAMAAQDMQVNRVSQ
jgi:YHS domain-containing protein